jgi:hypothetical protein
VTEPSGDDDETAALEPGGLRPRLDTVRVQPAAGAGPVPPALELALLESVRLPEECALVPAAVILSPLHAFVSVLLQGLWNGDALSFWVDLAAAPGDQADRQESVCDLWLTAAEEWLFAHGLLTWPFPSQARLL